MPVNPPASLAEAACAVLATADARGKADLSRDFARAWRAGALADVGAAAPPARPARPARPELKRPRDMAKRGAGNSRAGRIALLHAIAHIELNAIDLAWDLIARFTDDDPPRAFYDDWVGVADDEARHFRMLSGRLADYGTAYGDLPAHDGLWEAAESTAGDLLARLAVVPMVLEARGLDVTPAMVERLERFGDGASAGLLRIIFEEEIGHVAAGVRWFEYLCARRGLDIPATWRGLVDRHVKGALKPPFNDAARRDAGMKTDLYRQLP